MNSLLYCTHESSICTHMMMLCSRTTVKYIIVGCVSCRGEMNHDVCAQTTVNTICLHSHSVADLLYQLKHSKPFRRRFASFATLYGTTATSTATKSRRYMLTLSHNAIQWIDYNWCYRIIRLAYRRASLMESMNWLSTLGGGYSALGDTFRYHAKRAGTLSVHQLKLAIHIGDDVAMIRCHLFLALSLMQQGHLLSAENIIRHQYKASRRIRGGREQLHAICLALWNRLGYMYKCRQLVNNTAVNGYTSIDGVQRIHVN